MELSAACRGEMFLVKLLALGWKEMNSCMGVHRLLTQKPNSTVDSDFIIRMLFKDSY